MSNQSSTKAKYNKSGFGLAIGLVIGGGIGMIYGYAIDNFTLGLVLGSVGGMLIGLAISSALAARNS